MSDRRCPPLQELMACLLYQLVEFHPDLVQHGAQKIETAIQSEAWQNTDGQLALEAMRACMLSLLGLFPTNEKITLVLDWFDKCYSGSQSVSGQVLLMQLLQLVVVAPCVLKILVVTNSTSWKIRPDQRARILKDGGSCYIKKLD